MTDNEIIALFYAALDSAHGVVIATSSAELLKKRLYVVRASEKKLGNLMFNILSFRTSPIDSAGQVWIVKNKEKVDGKEE